MAAGLPELIEERAGVANSWRIGPDGVSMGRSMLNAELDANLSEWAGPGHWNNPGLLISSRNDGAAPPAPGKPNRRISELQVRVPNPPPPHASPPVALSPPQRVISRACVTRNNTLSKARCQGSDAVFSLRRAGLSADHLGLDHIHVGRRPGDVHQRRCGHRLWLPLTSNVVRAHCLAHIGPSCAACVLCRSCRDLAGCPRQAGHTAGRRALGRCQRQQVTQAALHCSSPARKNTHSPQTVYQRLQRSATG